MLLLKNIECVFRHSGKKDLLIAGGKIEKIYPAGKPDVSGIADEVLCCDGLTAYPGLIDPHVHILGGGGEEGFSSRIGEITAEEIFSAGVTTLVGLLGADSVTRSMKALYAKAKALESAGISTYLYSGCYSVPPATLTGSVTGDLVLIDKVLGIGEIAVADHRSSYPGLSGMMELAAETHLGGMLGGKAGVLHLHMGDGKQGLTLLREMLEHSDLPIGMFMPTHLNRSARLFKEGVEYCRSGGFIDLTAGEKAGVPVPDAVSRLIAEGVDLSHVTVSSDANGSVPGGKPARIQELFNDLRGCILEKGISPETVIPLFCENTAKILKLYSQKGVLQEGSDADILLTDKNYHVQILICGGKVCVKKLD